MKKIIYTIQIIGLIIFLGSAAAAQPLMVNNFDYPTGALLTSNGRPSPTSADVKASGVGSQIFTGYETEPQTSSSTPGRTSTMTEIHPQYIQGTTPTNVTRVPYAFRFTLTGLLANTTYRYINQVVIATDLPTASGAGNPIFVNQNGTFTRSTSPSLATANNYGEFTSNASGSFTGWFMNEPTGNARFTAGNEVFMRITLNNGAGGTTAASYQTSTFPVKVINFGTDANANQGTAIRGVSPATPKNFVFLYDNTTATGRPLIGTHIEPIGIDFAANTSYASFYRTDVAAISGAWGGIVPNINTNGVRAVTELALADASVLITNTSANGTWSTVNTANPTGGLGTVLVLSQVPGPQCQNASISNFPASAANICAGSVYTITFSGVTITNAASTLWQVTPANAGSLSSNIFTLNQGFDGGTVTISLSANAVPPCLDATAQVSFTVNPLPVVAVPANFAVCTDGAPVTLAGATPAGGIYSGPGVTSGIFTPSAAGAGVKTITYSFTNTNNCTNSRTFNITVNAKPVVTCPANMSVCLGVTPFLLTGGLPAGGTYSGVGVTSNIFNPTTAGLGAQTITYTYADAIGCTSSCTFTITVGASGTMTVAITASATEVCDGLPVTFNATMVNGGTSPTILWYVNNVLTFSGNAQFVYLFPKMGDVVRCVVTSSDPCFASTPVSSNAIVLKVNPWLEARITISGSANNVCAGTAVTYTVSSMQNPGTSPVYQWKRNNVNVGTNSTTYSYTPANGDVVTCWLTSSALCLFDNPIESNQITMVINPLPVIAVPANSAVCSNAAPVTLTGATPVGGVYSGIGVVTGVFTPSLAGVGTHTITYTFTNASNCIASRTFLITVNPLPTVTFNFTYSMVCINWPASMTTLTGGLPTGGTYSGPGVTAGVFNPVAAGVGSHTLTYTYTSLAGCISSAPFRITVSACVGIPDVSESYTVALYPNPASEKLFIGINVAYLKAELIRVFDIRGNVLQSFSNVMMNEAYPLDISRLQAGMYTLQLITDQGVIMKKFIVK